MKFEKKNWIPKPFQTAAHKIAETAVEGFVKGDQVIGLGSGPMAEAIISEMGRLSHNVKKTILCISTSAQIRHAALRGDLLLVEDDYIPKVDLVFDGADQVDSKFNMIKGGGGALLKEKIIHAAAKTIVITAESFKYLKSFNRSVPIEVHPFALQIVKERLKSEYKGSAELRLLPENYPYVTENGNFILDTSFNAITNVRKMEIELKSIPGIIEVGLFTKQGNVYYKANDDGSFKELRP
ncbi:MAG TPA: ribose 5-phosphate isomerase A [Nitrososphaeraceae archaeon]|jgi:ribose 5-phosphate isomerase A